MFKMTPKQKDTVDKLLAKGWLFHQRVGTSVIVKSSRGGTIVVNDDGSINP